MTVHVTFTDAHARLASLLDEVTANQEVVIIQRNGTEDVALIAASVLHSLEETAHLHHSPHNAERLLRALARAIAEEGAPQSIDTHRQGYSDNDLV